MESAAGTQMEFAEVVKYRFGAPVTASDGPSGYVTHVIVDPDGRLVTHVGVKLTRFGGHAYNIPTELVSDAHARGTVLAITRADIPQKAQQVSSSLARWDASTVLLAGGKTIGRLAQLTVRSDTHALRHLVVDRGLAGGEVLINGASVAEISSKQIAVTLNDAQMKALVAYRPDSDLEREANEALYNYPRLRVDIGGMRVRAIDGTIYLQGHISSDLNSRIAADQLVGIAGLGEVKNELITDTDLAAEVAAALSQDPRTQGQHIGVYPNLGTIYLRGVVDAPTAREAAESVAGAVAGVKMIRNELAVRPDAGVVPVLSAVTSREEQVPGGR